MYAVQSLAQERQRLSDAVAQRDADLQALLGQKRGLEGEVSSAQRAAHCGTLEAAVHAQVSKLLAVDFSASVTRQCDSPLQLFAQVVHCSCAMCDAMLAYLQQYCY
jgi:hypothetical protein